NTQSIEHLNPEEYDKNRMSMRMLLGSVMATGILTLIFMSLGESNKQDLRWMILPYLLVPIAGGLGGLVYHLLEPLRNQGSILKFASLSLSSMIYAFLFAVAFIMGVNGPD